MKETTRRNFLSSSAQAAVGASLLAAPAIAANRMSPNERLRVAVVGVRGRGQAAIRAFHALAEQQNVELAVLCDADQPVLEERAAGYEKMSGKKVKTYGDMRRIFDDKSIHVVSFATPNHWHALGTVWACQAGKDVYLEKPGSHNFVEGKKIIEAARKYGRVVQHGTQNRSSPNIVQGINKLNEGVIGRVYLARGIAYKLRSNVGKITEDPLPAGLNWDAWLGPAPHVPYSRRRHSRPAGGSWHLLWDYGNGEIGNQGVHELDIMRWGLGLDEHPTKIASMGGNHIFPDSEQDAPQLQSIMYEYKDRDVLMSFETRSGYTNAEAGMGAQFPFLDKHNAVGVIFVGTDGYMIMPDYSSYHTFLGPKDEPGPSSGRQRRLAVPRREGPSAVGAGDITDLPHFERFVKAVRSGNQDDIAGGPKDLHYSSALAHFANISYRTGRMLHFDAKAEKFAGDEEATRLLSRTYRSPYVMPETV